MKKLISFLGLLLLFTWVSAQSPVGKWKLIIGITETVNRKNTDFLKDLYKKDPCLANVIYIFSADGNIITNADKCPDSTRKTLEASNLAIQWEISGNNKIKITTKDKDIDPVTYDLAIWYHTTEKRAMTWVIIFGDDPEISNPEEVTRLMFTYYEL